ncbi:DNA polymerase III subunit delta [Williamsia deligens]|uniref:DNA polymerase III subunit delta n=1 Tax=Williamsia deligens TaxID=321325 RepID=A0ABW3G9T5_9NOCA|nr:DNA polymerase III subunit delta [Williamsia deligens]MCP2195691.1 DNA polymerase III, delta subunit [Williamsia deligens]
MVAVSDRLHLLLGDEDFLIERAVSEVRSRAVKDAGTDVPVTRVRAGDVGEHELVELLSPSLFGDARIVVVESAAEAGKEPAAAITTAARDLPDGITLAVAHSGGGRTKTMPAELRKAGAQVHDCAPVTRVGDRIAFVTKEFSSLGVKVSGEVAARLVETVRSDLRELAAACSQLVADTDGKIDLAAIDVYYSGRPEVTGFEIADAAVTGDKAAALEALAWAGHHGVPHVLVADALAEAVHAIARVRSVGGRDANSSAAELGMPPWRVRKVAGQAQGWTSEAVATAMGVVATLNGDVKGQAADADYSLQRAVAAVADLRPSMRNSR